jgi:hypothetical protein
MYALAKSMCLAVIRSAVGGLWMGRRAQHFSLHEPRLSVHSIAAKMLHYLVLLATATTSLDAEI